MALPVDMMAAVLGGIAVAALFLFLAARAAFGARAPALQTRIAELGAEKAALETANAELKEEGRRRDHELIDLRGRYAALEARAEAEAQAAAEKIALLDQAKLQLSDAFKALAAETLKANNQQFLDLAKGTFAQLQQGAESDLEARKQAIENLLKPINSHLDQLKSQTAEIEKSRAEAYGALKSQVAAMAEAQHDLRGETTKLVRALRAPQGRGRWGEIQLKRVVEMAGMIDHVDFFEQVSQSGEDGPRRPDLVVRMPGGSTIAVDAKTPLDAHLDAVNPDLDEAAREAARQRHARHLREHMKILGSKAYHQGLAGSVDFTVLFLPDEGVFSAALEVDPGLIEAGWQDRVLIATPINLIALLRTVHYGWRQEAMAENAREVQALGAELHTRLSTWLKHMEKLGRQLGTVTGTYNDAVGSLERSVMPQARRFEALGTVAPGKALAEPEEQTIAPRSLAALPEFSLEPDILTPEQEAV